MKSSFFLLSPLMGLRFSIFSTLIFLVCVTVESQQNHSSKIGLGFSLSPTSTPTSWSSPSGLFAFGFYAQDIGFKVGIWFNHSKTVVWTANRDDPPITFRSTLELTGDGKLVLRTEHGEKKQIAKTQASAVSASMLDSGNFVLYNNDSETIWETFAFPTDTILEGQNLSIGGKLVSSVSKTNSSTGRYQLKMQDDGNLVSYPLNTEETPIDAYWDSQTWQNAPDFLYLNHSGILAIINSTSLDMIQVLSGYNNNNNNTIIYRATLDFDGVFKLYSHKFDDSIVSIEWQAPENPCNVRGFCGLNSYCTLDDYRPYCLCLPGTDFIDPNQQSLGCGRNFSQEGCKGGIENTTSFNITTMDNMVWGDVPYADETMSIEDCKTSCLEDCNCEAARYVDNYCRKQSLPLRYVRRDISENTPSKVFFKVETTSIIKSENGTTQFAKPTPLPPQVLVKSRNTVMLILVVTMGLLTSSCAALAISGIYFYKFRVLKYKRLLQYGNSCITEKLTMQLFSYSELKKATNGFKEELGKGSFGAVYKGTLCFAGRELSKLTVVGDEEVDMKTLENMVKVGLWCIQDEPALRPSMKSVVMMLEGITDISIPPCPTTY
ncbi:G-type lectin S-receptor-like serine/threonine-protein kinase LECRK3 [Camellia lanceoleosa]|uniref:G-type lectin S-receptor-like serine/threonine-protein kinase LECRK3 n=1 Tax=Camellia lanceoleosa TaxID=1840588 RepID=A0ACC0HIY0_9ERIC|nr:G-type lectin S-receptor-like serine/threonine-protein kinase LECRK3 [Camellia lanceoleosa]